MSGFETESLVILAGISSPYDHFELQSLTYKTLKELGLDYSNKKEAIKRYIRYLIEKSNVEELDITSLLKFYIMNLITIIT